MSSTEQHAAKISNSVVNIDGNAVTEEGCDDSEDDDDNDDRSSTSTDSDGSEEDPGETIEFYVGLLMKLIPPLEGLYKQSSTSKGKDAPVSSLPTAPTRQILDVVRPKTSHSSLAKGSNPQLSSADGFEPQNLELTEGPDPQLRSIDEPKASNPNLAKDFNTQLPILDNSGSQHVNTDAEKASRFRILPPVDESSRRFEEQLIALSKTPIAYENPGLLDEAMQSLPLDEIYSDAQREFGAQQAAAKNDHKRNRPKWGYQDFMIRVLLR